MLIDDEALDNFLNEKIIKESSFAKNVLIHSSAKSGLEFLKNIGVLDNSKCLTPDLIFLDINMPFIDGFQFLDEFERLFPELKSIKIVVLTGSMNPADEEKSMTYKQVVGYFHKPLSSENLVRF